jgi:hypothetical protein
MELNYRVYDNSFCIDVNTGISAHLVQHHDIFYRPNPSEDGAIFTICSNPYDEYIDIYGLKKFINVKSSRTGHIYRVLFNESAIY